jgi:hypothetical protein
LTPFSEVAKQIVNRFTYSHIESGHLQSKLCPNAIGHKGFRKIAGNLKSCPPPRTVLWDNDLWFNLFKGLNSWTDYRFKDLSGEVKSPYDGINILDAGYVARVLQRVDKARVAASGQHD